MPEFYSFKKILISVGFLLGTASYGQTYLENFFRVSDEWATLGNSSYFFAHSRQGEEGLWKTDGTQKGTQFVKSVRIASFDPINLFIYQDAVYFAAWEEGEGVELWKSDGTPQGTQMFKNLNEGEISSSWPSNFTIYNGLLYFTASNQYINGRQKLHVSDGTIEGTVLADHIFDADTFEGVGNLIVANDKLYFTRSGILYETDGTSEDTRNVVIDGLQYISNFYASKDGLYFTTHNHGKTVLRLYRLTGIDDYTMVKEYFSESNSGFELYGLTEINDTVVFTVGSGETYNNIEDTLWKTDGTPEGTSELISFGNQNLFNPGNLKGFIEYDGNLYFDAGPASNASLWKTDGTLQGTMEVIPNAGLSGYAPMVTLNNKLYFLRNLTLHSYDSATQQSTAISQLISTRKSTGDNYFVKSDGNYVYTAVRNEREDDIYSSMDLFHSGPNPLMKVRVPWEIKNDETINFNSKIDSLIIKEVRIQNFGNEPLAFSKVFVSGEGFYINGEVNDNLYQPQSNFPQQIAPSETGLFEIGFLPQTSGTHEGYLIIRSNNTSQSEFRIKLVGNVSEAPPLSTDATFPTEKEIKWDNSEDKIELDNSFISENAVSGAVVGILSTNSPGDSFTYQLIEGTGSADNNIFSIVNNQLMVGNKFQVDFKKSYTIRVKSTDNNGEEVEESFVIGVNEESLEVELGACDQIAVSLTSDLYAVDFIDDTDAVAVGYNGVILKTFDKGISWQQTHIIEQTNLLSNLYTFPSNLYEVNFVNENTGFVVGREVLLRTDNAGISWKPIDFEKLSSLDSYHAMFEAISPEILFIYVDDYIYKSIDGGQTWLNSNFFGGSGDPRTLYFYDENLGFLSNSHENYAITNDGGESWTTYDLGDTEGLSYDEDITAFYFLNTTLGFAGTSKGKLLKTEDGGASWSILSSTNGSKINNIHFTDEINGTIVAGPLYETNDGGQTLTSVALDVCARPLNFAANNLGDKIVVGSGCYVGNGRTIYVAPSDGPWTQVSSIYGSGDVENIIFDGSDAYLFSRSQSRKSTDGGVTWKELITPIDENILEAEKIADAIIIQSFSREFYKSTDGGLNWNSLYTGSPIISFDTFNENTIVAINEDGDLIKSTDSGTNWATVATINENFNGYINFIDDSVGFITRFDGYISTIDGGLSWNNVIVDIENIYIYSFNFITSQIGFFSSNKGYFKTNDGGQTWIPLPLNAAWSRNLISVDEQVWYIASGRTIYITTDSGVTWEPFFSGEGGILDLIRVNETIYFSDNDGGVFKLTQDPSPLNAGYIKGDKIVRVGDTEIYSVVKQSDNRYAWTVTGNNRLTSEDNFARVLWNEPGSYILQTTPYATCSTGEVSEITVTVLPQPSPPEINGPNRVVENSNGLIYTTPLESEVSYIWSVSGHRFFSTSENTLTVDWGRIGEGEIGLIKTDLLTGLRSYSKLVVQIDPRDPFNILQSNATCREVTNGSLHIASRLPEVLYSAILTGPSISSNAEFSGEVYFNDLSSGVYDLCIQDIETSKEYCYQFTISQPEAFEVTSKVSSGLFNKIDLEFEGGKAPYTILLNGSKIAETSQKKIQISASNGDMLEVHSAGDCSLSYSKLIQFQESVAVIPNPVESSFTAFLPDNATSKNQEIIYKIFNSTGQMVLSNKAIIFNNTIECQVPTLKSGIYIVQLNNDQKSSFKIVKK